MENSAEKLWIHETQSWKFRKFKVPRDSENMEILGDLEPLTILENVETL